MADKRRQFLAILHVFHQNAEIVVDHVVVFLLQRLDEHVSQLGNGDDVLASDFQQHVHEIQAQQALISVILCENCADHVDQRHQFHGFPVLFELQCIEEGNAHAFEQFPACGLRLLLDFLLRIGVAGKQNAEQASVGNRPFGHENELVDPRDDGESNESIVVMHQIEKNVDLDMRERCKNDHGVHYRVVRLAAFDFGEKRLQNIVGFLYVSRFWGWNHADFATFVAEKQEKPFHELREVFEHVNAWFVV